MVNWNWSTEKFKCPCLLLKKILIQVDLFQLFHWSKRIFLKVDLFQGGFVSVAFFHPVTLSSYNLIK